VFGLGFSGCDTVKDLIGEGDPGTKEPGGADTTVSLNLNTLYLGLETGSNSATLEAAVSPANAANKAVTWESSDPTVATVDANGNVKGVKAGSATVTVTAAYGGSKAKCTVTVKPGTPDTTPPADVTGLAGTPGDQQVVLSWTDPADADLDHIEVTWTPDGTAPQTVNKGIRTYTATGLANGTTYTFTVKAVDTAGNKNSGTPVTATPVGGDEIGLTWTAVNNAGSQHLYGIAYGGNTFVAVGDEGKTAYSADGVTWAAGADIPYAIMASGIAYDNGTFVAVGGNGVLAYSTDGGETWTAATSSSLTEGLRGIAYGGDKFVAVGNNGTAAYSRDGNQPWEAANTAALNDSFIMDIAYGGDKFVAVDSSGTAAYSYGGTSWAAAQTGLISALYGIAYGGDKFVAVGAGGTAVYSINGANWTSAQTGLTSDLIGIAYGGGKFVAVGAEGQTVYSADGATWTVAQSGLASSINGIAYGDGRFVAVGDYGKVVYSNKQE
jgi:photosystem II stability/assembly factor-like uncharacterized protein